MNKKAKIVFICMIFVAKGTFCQHITDKINPVKGFVTLNPVSKKSSSTNKYFNKTITKKLAQAVNYNSGISLNPASVSVISANHYTQNFGFFCKKELQIEKVTKIPLRFRLGSLSYNDYIEGKPNAINPF